jgi:hypothetical protein
VIDVGLVRIYLMELAGADFHPTGRIVVLSNAVLFQPAALFKQVPGADYVWHVFTLTFAATADAQLVENRLREAAGSVYEGYRPAIEQHHARLQRYVNIETLPLHPEVTVRLTSAGLECSVRYPTEPTRAAETDRKMIDVLRAAIAKEPALTLSPPRVQASNRELGARETFSPLASGLRHQASGIRHDGFAALAGTVSDKTACRATPIAANVSPFNPRS